LQLNRHCVVRREERAIFPRLLCGLLEFYYPRSALMKIPISPVFRLNSIFLYIKETGFVYIATLFI
jgi:hypothetical protein